MHPATVGCPIAGRVAHRGDDWPWHLDMWRRSLARRRQSRRQAGRYRRTWQAGPGTHRRRRSVGHQDCSLPRPQTRPGRLPLGRANVLTQRGSVVRLADGGVAMRRSDGRFLSRLQGCQRPSAAFPQIRPGERRDGSGCDEDGEGRAHVGSIGLASYGSPRAVDDNFRQIGPSVLSHRPAPNTAASAKSPRRQPGAAGVHWHPTARHPSAAKQGPVRVHQDRRQSINWKAMRTRRPGPEGA